MVFALQRFKRLSTKQISILFVIVVLVVSVLLRFPAFYDLQNTDVWYLIWESRLIFDERHLELIMHPFSIIGLYPYSPYPFGSLLLYKFFDIISFQNVFVGVLLYNITLISLASISSFYFFKKIFKKSETKENNGLTQENIIALIGSLLYVNFPYLIYFSYNFASARLPMMVILPLFYLFALETIKRRSILSFLKCFSMFFVMLFFHRMSEPLVLLVIILGLYLIFFKFLANKLKIKERIPKMKSILSKYFIVILLGSFAVAVVTSFFIDAYSGIRILGTGLGWWQFLEHITHILSDIFFEGWGPMIFVSLLGIIFIKSNYIKKDNSYYNVLLVTLFQIPLLVLISNHYIIYFMCITPILFIALYLKNFLLEKENYKPIYGAIALTCFGLLNVIGAIFIYRVRSNYHHAYIIIGSIVLLLSFGFLIALLIEKQNQNKEKESKKLNAFIKGTFKAIPIILTLSMLFYSRFYIDLQTIYKPQGFPDYYSNITLTDEEQEIADYLSLYPESLFGCSQRLVAIRLSVLSGCYYLADTHGLALLLSGHYNVSEIKENTTFNLLYGGWDFSLYTTSGDYPTGREIFIDLIQMEANATSLAIINDINLSFFITFKNSSYVEIRMTEYVESPFVQTISNIATPVFETDNFYVWAF